MQCRPLHSILIGSPTWLWCCAWIFFVLGLVVPSIRRSNGEFIVVCRWRQGPSTERSSLHHLCSTGWQWLGRAEWRGEAWEQSLEDQPTSAIKNSRGLCRLFSVEVHLGPVGPSWAPVFELVLFLLFSLVLPSKQSEGLWWVLYWPRRSVVDVWLILSSAAEMDQNEGWEKEFDVIALPSLSYTAGGNFSGTYYLSLCNPTATLLRSRCSGSLFVSRKRSLLLTFISVSRLPSTFWNTNQ